MEHNVFHPDTSEQNQNEMHCAFLLFKIMYLKKMHPKFQTTKSLKNN